MHRPVIIRGFEPKNRGPAEQVRATLAFLPCVRSVNAQPERGTGREAVRSVTLRQAQGRLSDE